MNNNAGAPQGQADGSRPGPYNGAMARYLPIPVFVVFLLIVLAPGCSDDGDSPIDAAAGDGPAADVSAVDGPGGDAAGADAAATDATAADAATDAVSCASLGPNTYYVDGQGLCGQCSDTRTRAQNSITTPWCKVGRAVAQLQAGDTVYVRAGLYKEGISIKTGGAAGKPIVYAAFPGEQAELQAGIPVHIEADHVQIVGLRLTLSSFYGVRVVNASNIVIKSNRIYSVDKNGSKCIYLSGVSDAQILDNDISFTEDGIHTGGKLVNVTVQGNTIIGRYKVFPAGAHADGMQMRSSPVQNLKIINNVIQHGESANLFLEPIGGGPWKDVVVAGNLLLQEGDGLAGKHVHFSPVAGLTIECNTMVTLSSSGTGYTHGISIGASTAVTVRNNVLYDSVYFASASFSSDYNLLYRNPNNSKPLIGSSSTLAAYQAANPGQEVHSVEGDPLFSSVAKGDFSLKAASPGKDKGTACSNTAVDLLKKKRPQGKGWDIGAYE